MSPWFLASELSTCLTRENIDEFLLRKIWQIKILTKMWLVAVVNGRKILVNHKSFSFSSIFFLVRNLYHTVCSTKEHKVAHSPVTHCQSNTV